MAKVELPAPGPQDSAFVTEAEAAGFFHVHPRQLAHAANRYPWLGRQVIAKSVTYSQRGIALLAEMLEKKIVGHEIFSRPPDDPTLPRKHPRRPHATRQKDDEDGGDKGGH